MANQVKDPAVKAAEAFLLKEKAKQGWECNPLTFSRSYEISDGVANDVFK